MITNEAVDYSRPREPYPGPPPPDERQDSFRPNWKAVYTIVERNGRKHWLRIGIAFTNRDLSLNVRLDAMPVNGQLQIREPFPREGGGRDLDERGHDELSNG